MQRNTNGNRAQKRARFGFGKIGGYSIPSKMGKPDRNKKTNRNRFTVKAKLKRRAKAKS